MKKFVLLTGILNVIMGILFTLPCLLQRTGLEPPANPFWLLFPAIFLFFLGFILIFSSRDLKNRATIVFWDGLSRVAAFLGFSWFGLFAGMGIDMVFAASVDLVIAIVYFIGLPRSLDRSFISILLDRRY